MPKLVQARSYWPSRAAMMASSVIGNSHAGRGLTWQDRVPIAGDPVLQHHDRVDDHLRPRRTAGHVDVHRDDLVHALDHRVVAVEPAARSAGAEGHDPLRLA